MALQNSDNFIVSRGGTNHRLTWANLITDIQAGDVLDTAFSVTGDPATALETVVPYSASYGIKLPQSGVNDYEEQGSLRYNPVSNKIELYSGTSWGTASGNTAFSSAPLHLLRLVISGMTLTTVAHTFIMTTAIASSGLR